MPDQTPDAAVAFLATNDADCPACHHQLRGVPDPICPECGVPLELGIRAPSIRHSGWVGSLIACSMGLGFDVVVVAIFIWQLVIQFFNDQLAQVPADFWMIFLTLVPLALLCLGAIVVLWKRRHTILVLPFRLQITFTIAAFFLVGGVHAGMGLWLIGMLII